MHLPRHSLCVLLLLAAVLPLRAQQNPPSRDEDKVLLVRAKSAHLIEENGESFRKVVGPALFRHNNTDLLCDTALWNVNTNIIDAIGHVRIIQDQTQLSSETLQYVVDEDMAKFRGALVQLEDKDKNTLRTRYLDYNTKDSVAIFQNGAAMRDKDGQVIESIYGTYDSKARLFVFNDQVNMYLDTTFVKTSRLEYRSDLSTAFFGFGTDMWQDDKMLSADDGWYDRSHELFFFRRNVHLLTSEQETWSDSLYYYRDLNNVDMLGHVEVMDTTRNMYALAGFLQYTDSLSQLRMTREPAVMSVVEEKQKRDTVYLGAEVLTIRGIPRCAIPEPWLEQSKKRLSDIGGDPVMEYRKKAAEEAAKAAEEAAKKDPNRPPTPPAGNKNGKASGAKGKASGTPTPPAARPDSLRAGPAEADSLALTAPVDSLPPVEEAPDSTKVNFVWGSKRVRLFKRDMQMSSDSLTYSDLDSLVRLYQDPVFFNEGNRQYASDSIYMVIKNKQMEKAHLLSNAFITIEEAPSTYDQIRGTEMVAYFDSASTLTRFDALGGASSLFYLEEDGALATVNKVESKMIYATFKDGEIERMYYYDNPKNDGYPSVQLPVEDRTLKGFRWEPERRPASPLDVTSLKPRISERTSYLARPHTEFKQTEDYFPGHIRKIYRDIALRDSLQVVRDRARQREKDSLDRVKSLPDSLPTPSDSLKAPTDSLQALPDSLKALPDSLKAGADSLSVKADSLGTGTAPKELSAKELRAKERAERQAAKQAALEAKWAEEDRLYEERKAAREQKKLDRERARKLKALRKMERRAQRDRKRFEKYLERERKKSLRQTNKKKK